MPTDRLHSAREPTDEPGMGLFRKPAYDRRRILEQARVAARKGKRRKAIALYQRILEVEPEDVEIHRRLAPLLARAKQVDAALLSFDKAVVGLVRQGMEDKAIGVCREVLDYYPKRPEVWEALARLELDRKRTADALDAIRNGRRRCRRRAQRGDAIRLLRLAQEIAPDDVEVTTDLALLLRRSGRRPEALRLLDALARRTSGARLRSLRWAELRIDPSLARLVAWLRPRSTRSSAAARA